MELISLYLVNSISFERNNISNSTYEKLLDMDWVSDRINTKYQIFTKRFMFEEKIYRVLIRFSKSRKNTDSYELSEMTPFSVAECVPVQTLEKDNSVSDRWKDLTLIHGPTHGSLLGMIRAGLPYGVVTLVHEDLKKSIQYI